MKLRTLFRELTQNDRKFYSSIRHHSQVFCSLKIDYPDAEIMGHCELEGVHKACPSFSCEEYRDYFENIDMLNQ